MDCFLMFAHPAFQALLPLLGIPADTDVTAFYLRCIRFDMLPEVRISKQNKGLYSSSSENMPPPSIECGGLYHSPEFKAFAEAIGFQWDIKTIEYVIDAPGEGHIVRITQTYMADIKQHKG